MSGNISFSGGSIAGGVSIQINLLISAPAITGMIAMPVNPHDKVPSVQDVFGSPVASGTYGGGSVFVPMDAVALSAPIGRVVPSQAPRPGPRFDALHVTSTP